MNKHQTTSVPSVTDLICTPNTSDWNQVKPRGGAQKRLHRPLTSRYGTPGDPHSVPKQSGRMKLVKKKKNVSAITHADTFKPALVNFIDGTPPIPSTSTSQSDYLNYSECSSHSNNQLNYPNKRGRREIKENNTHSWHLIFKNITSFWLYQC